MLYKCIYYNWVMIKKIIYFYEIKKNYFLRIEFWWSKDGLIFDFYGYVIEYLYILIIFMEIKYML